MSYVPEAYEAASSLEILHNAARVQGSNVISVPADGSFSLSADDPSVEYLIGVTVGPAVMLLMFLVWTVLLCCVGCCCKRRCCSDRVASFLFVGCMVLSCFGWFYSLGANGVATGGVDTLFGSGDLLEALVDNAVIDANKVIAQAESINVTTNLALTSCLVVTAAVGSPEELPVVDLTDAIDVVRESVNGVVENVDEIKKLFNDAQDTTEPLLTSWRGGYLVVIISIIVLTVVFTLSTVWRIFENAPGKESRMASCLSQTSGTVFLTVGVLLLVLIWVAIALLAVFTTMGADLCVPSPTATLQRVADEVSIALDQRDGSTPLCDEAPYSYVCYYQTCVGTSPIDDEFIDTLLATASASSLLGGFNTVIAEIVGNLTAANVTVPAEAAVCQSSLATLETDIDEVNALVAGFLDFVDCAQINPIYAQIVEDGFCNEVMAGLATMWITMATAATSLMFGLLVYRIFAFDKAQQMMYNAHVANAQPYKIDA